MIREITPNSKNKRSALAWLGGMGVYGFSSITSSVLLGALLGLTSQITSIIFRSLDWKIIIGVVSIFFALIELAILPIRVPSTGWQVPANWSRFGKPLQALLYGLSLGPGIFSFIPFSTFYIILLFEASLGLLGGILIGFVYSFFRLLSILVSSGILSTKVDGVDILDDIFKALPLLHRLSGVFLLSIAQVLFASVYIAK